MLGVPSKAEPEQHWLPHRILEKIVLLSWEQLWRERIAEALRTL
jgi:hypothetical protein